MSRIEDIEARANAATEGPWWGGGSNRRRDSIGLVGRLSDRGTGNAIAVLNGVGMDRVADAEFIAHARTDVPDLVAFVREVEALHQPKPDGVGDMHDAEGNYLGYGDISPACGTCGQHDEYAVPWPCPTARALDRLNGGA